jgi:hypothetical protein
MIRSSVLVVAVLLLVGLSAFAQTVQSGEVARRHTALVNKGVRFAPVQLFERVPTDAATSGLWSGALAKAEVFRMDPLKVVELLGEQPEHIALELPSVAGSVVLELQRTKITTDDFVVSTASRGKVVEQMPGLHYRGVVRGVAGSIVAISVFPDQVMGLLSDVSGERVLGLFDHGPKGLHVYYHEDDLLARSNATCFAVDDADPYERSKLAIEGAPKTTRCVRNYWEVNFDIFQNKGSVVNTVNYVTGLFNQSAILFDNDGIDITLSEVFVWDVASPYTQTTTSALLNQFGVTRTSFNGDMAHLLGFAGGGGIAWLNTLCSSTNYRMAYSDINSTYNNVPTYSWSVEVVTHEQGHNLGSRHTHACAWNGNNTAIDGCGPAAGYTEGSCAQGPLPSPSVGGTIMSYCHLTSSGINFANGFGPQPTAVIVNAVNGANCLTVCGTSCDAPGNLTAYALTTTSATLSWSSVGATSYTLQWKPSASSTWTTVTGLTGNTYNLTGLTQTTPYDFRVLSICGASSSAYSGIHTFTTPTPCPDALEPNNSLAAAAAITLPANINALIATSSDVDHYSFTLPSTANINISLSGLVADFDVRLLNSGGTQLAISENGGSASENISYASAPAGTYYVHVFGYAGAFSATSCYALGVSAFTPQGCAMPTGVQVSAITWNSATVSWAAALSASSYDLRWKAASSSTWTTVSALTGTSHPLTGLAPLTLHDVQVRANCAGGTQGGSSQYTTTVQFTTLAAPCAVAPPVRVSLKVMLDGPYRSTTGLMVDSLRAKSLLPLQEPYTALGLGVAETVSTTPAVLSVTGSNAIVDWVVVELRNATTPSVIVEARAALLQRDGDVVGVDGVSPLGFCSAAGGYKLAVRHRNHLACMTNASFTLGATTTVVDLTLAATTTHGTNARKTLGGVMALWAGNAVANAQLSYTGTANDRDAVLAAIGGTVPTNTATGYLLADVNLDGSVVYTGGGNDRDVILGNIGGTVPTNVLNEQLP